MAGWGTVEEGDPPKLSFGAAMVKKYMRVECSAFTMSWASSEPQRVTPQAEMCDLHPKCSQVAAVASSADLKRGAGCTRGKVSVGNVCCLLGMIWGP